MGRCKEGSQRGWCKCCQSYFEINLPVVWIIINSVLLQGHHPDMGAHAKFTNYYFDADEFENLVKRASDHVKSHPSFQIFTSSYPAENGYHSHPEL